MLLFRVVLLFLLDVSSLQIVILSLCCTSCFSTITLAADSTGTELCVEPGSRKSDAQPEPFTWKVQGSTLVLQFAERRVQLNIAWIHGDSIRYRPGRGYGTWFRVNPQNSE